ncbi:MAG: IS110 family transposase [Candidatus Rhabdochlamydia sp.]
MEEIYERCCGLDVHRDSITACVMIGYGAQKRKIIKTFLTFTQDIRELANWLKSHEIIHVSVESTGIYWKPIFNIFEEQNFDICLVNAQHVKNVPGRKTDVKDSEWLCKLLKCGLLSKSFIPPRKIVRLREILRYRQKLVRELSSGKNRLIKTLENANIKLSTVFSDVFGLTAWIMISKLANGETNPETLTAYIDPRCKSSKAEILKALQGTLQKEDKIMLKKQMNHLNTLQDLIQDLEKEIEMQIKPFKEEVELLKTIPGIKDMAAMSIIAEIGPDMNQFKSASHLSAWAGMCPGNNQSAGKIKSSRTRKGNVHVKVMLTQVAWAVSRTKQTYLGAKYRSLAPRRGKKRAIIAIGRKILVICYHILKEKMPFYELGVDFLDKLEPERKAKYHIMRLEELGYHVISRKKID